MKPKRFASFAVIVSLLVIGFVILAQPRPSVSPLISPLPTADQPAVWSPTPQDVVATTRTPFPTLAITPPRLPLPTYTAAPTLTPIVFATPGEVWVVSADGASRRVVAGPVATASSA